MFSHRKVVEDMEETAALELEHLEAMKYTQTQAELRIEKDHNHFKYMHMCRVYTRIN